MDKSNKTDDAQQAMSCSENKPKLNAKAEPIQNLEPDNHDDDDNAEKEEYVLFFGRDSPFSQHHPAQFQIDDMCFNCAEQYMMYMKAVTFKDQQSEINIMKSTNPVIQKRLGRHVQNFDLEVWKTKSVEVVKQATEAKFSQNGELKEALLATHPKLLVECNPYDCVWGIGLGKTNPAARDKSQWRGKNLLGNILTEYRDKLWAETHSQTH